MTWSPATGVCAEPAGTLRLSWSFCQNVYNLYVKLRKNVYNQYTKLRKIVYKLISGACRQKESLWIAMPI